MRLAALLLLGLAAAGPALALEVVDGSAGPSKWATSLGERAQRRHEFL